jgi:hypothetical protein
MTLDPSVRSLDRLAENFLDLFAHHFLGWIRKKGDCHLDPNVVACFIVPNIPCPEGSNLLSVAVAFLLSDHGLGRFAVAETKDSNSAGFSHDSSVFRLFKLASGPWMGIIPLASSALEKPLANKGIE